MLTPNIALIGVGALLLLIGIVCGVVASRNEDRLLAIDDTPTSTAQDIQRFYQANGAHGQACEIIGVVESDMWLSGPLTGQPCTAYSHSLVWEEWGRPTFGSRHVGVDGLAYRDGGTEFDDRAVAFWVRDATGRVLVDPANAEFDLKEIDQRYEVTTSSMGNSERRVRRAERALPLGHQVYVLGYLCEEKGQPAIGRHPGVPAKKFLISYRSERELTRVSRWRSYGYYIAAGVSGSLGAVLLVWQVLRLKVPT